MRILQYDLLPVKWIEDEYTHQCETSNSAGILATMARISLRLEQLIRQEFISKY
jgi:hypothetical protein